MKLKITIQVRVDAPSDFDVYGEDGEALAYDCESQLEDYFYDKEWEAHAEAEVNEI